MASSQKFQVEDSNAVNTASSESAAATSTGASGIPSAGAAESGLASQSPVAAESAGLSQGTKLGIGLVVGLSFAFIVALIVSIMFCLRGRKQRRRAVLRANDAQRDIPIADDAEKLVVGSRYSSGAESWFTKSSGKTKSYHDPFEFQNEDGGMKSGWEKLFGRNGVPQRSRSGRLLFRS